MSAPRASGRWTMGMPSTLSTIDTGADTVRQRRDRGDVDDRHGRVAGTLEEDAAGLGPERAFPGVEVRAVHEVGLDSVARQHSWSITTWHAPNMTRDATT